jgi:hypothetical protein
MIGCGVVGAAGEIIMRASFISDKSGSHLGFAQAAITGGFDQMAEDESNKSITRLGRLKNEFTNVAGQDTEIVRISYVQTDYRLSLTCNTTDYVQTDIDSIQTNLGTLSQSDCLSFGVIGDASAGHRLATWTWRVGTNGVSSGQLVPANGEHSYVIISR